MRCKEVSVNKDYSILSDVSGASPMCACRCCITMGPTTSPHTAALWEQATWLRALQRQASAPPATTRLSR